MCQECDPRMLAIVKTIFERDLAEIDNLADFKVQRIIDDYFFQNGHKEEVRNIASLYIEGKNPRVKSVFKEEFLFIFGEDVKQIGLTISSDK